MEEKNTVYFRRAPVFWQKKTLTQRSSNAKTVTKITPGQILWFLLLLFVSFCRKFLFDHHNHNGTSAGGNSNAGRTWGEGRNGYAFCCFSLLFIYFHLFLHFTLLLFRLFLFRQVQQQARHQRKTPAGRDAAGGANGYVFFYMFVLLTLLFYSYHSSSSNYLSFSGV